MLGTIMNTIAIIAGCLIGFLLKGGIPEKINDAIMKGLGLFVLYVGIAGTLKGDNPTLIIFSVVIGAVVGEIIDIDRRLKSFGDIMEKTLKGRGGRISEAFVTSSLMYCVGAMAIVGSLESGLSGNHQILFTKSALDGLAAIVFTSSLGIGVIFSSVPVLLYQGAITLAAAALKGVLITAVISNMTAIGSLLIMGLGLNMLGITKIKVANLLPGVFIPIIYQLVYPYIIIAYQVVVRLI